MKRDGFHRWKYHILPCAAVLALVSCQPAHKRAAKRLAADGIKPSCQALVEAIADGRRDHVHLLLATGIDPSSTGAGGTSALRAAIEAGHPGIAFELLDHGACPADPFTLERALARREAAVAWRMVDLGADPSATNADGDRLVAIALRDGHLPFFYQAIHSGVDPDTRDPNGDALVHIAVRTGRPEVAVFLIQQGADAAARASCGSGLIDLALAHDGDSWIETFAAAGADPNLRGADGTTPLERAIATHRLDHAQSLLAAGADPAATAPTKQPRAIDLALESGREEFLDLILRSGVKVEPAWIATAISTGRISFLDLLAKFGAKFDNPLPNGGLPLELAVRQRNHAATEWLAGRDSMPGRALSIAAELGDTYNVRLLLAAGVPPDPSTPSDSALGIAIRLGHDDAAIELLRAGADWRPLSVCGQPVFHLAVARGSHGVVRALLNAGADPNEPFAQPIAPEFIDHIREGLMRWALPRDPSLTPLMVAADSGSVETVLALLGAGASRNVRAKRLGYWPINFASRRNDIPIMRAMLGRDPWRDDRVITITLSTQQLVMVDAEGNEIFTCRVSTGRKGKETPEGEFIITNKYRTWTSTIFNVAMPYFQRFSCGDFGIHQGHVPNYPASAGCVRVPAAAAKKLFGLTQTGDRVRIVP